MDVLTLLKAHNKGDPNRITNNNYIRNQITNNVYKLKVASKPKYKNQK
jgi:hypothetical protein